MAAGDPPTATASLSRILPDPEHANRGNGAIHAKLDGLVRAQTDADNEFIGIEHLTDQELKKILKRVEENAYLRREERKRRSANPGNASA